MTKEELASILDGRQIGLEVNEEISQGAKRDGLVIVYGASDDLMEFEGAIHDERGVYDGGEAIVDSQGLIPEREEIDRDEELEAWFIRRKQKHFKIEALWCKEKGYSWTFRTDIPHATFEILEDGKPYCRGIVFEMPT